MPRRIENRQIEKLVVVVSFDGFSNAIFVGFFYSPRLRRAPDDHSGVPGGPRGAPPDAESEPELRSASHFGAATGVWPRSGLWLAYNVQLALVRFASWFPFPSISPHETEALPIESREARGRSRKVTQCAEPVRLCSL